MSWLDGVLLRRTLVALVMLALSLAGIGRGLAAASVSAPPFIVIDGFIVSLCHTDDGSGGSGDPLNGGHHDCCDQCTLRAPIDVPVVPAFAPPARIAHFVEFDAAAPKPPSVARLRTPRSSQGPPSA